jgi:CPA2 family monovalent cation:H+ antiporter-2
MIGITLVEDLAVVGLTVLMPALGAVETGRLLAIGGALAKSALILVPFVYLAARGLPPVMTRVARTGNPELFLLVALAIGIGAAALTQGVGLSLALGAFLAGLLISESDYAHETLARLLPLRDAFVALFFVTLGVLVDPRLLFSNLPLLSVMVGLIMVGKLVLWAGVVALFGYPAWTAVLVGVGLTQIGEFSFVLVQAARAAGHVGAEVYNATLAAALLTILLNALLVRTVPGWLGRTRLARQIRRVAGETAEGAPAARVVVGGFGRIGSAVGEALDTFGVPYVVVDTDPDVVQALRARGIPVLYGDVSHPRLLEAAGVGRAPLVVLAVPEASRTRLATERARALNPAVPILARVHHRAEHDALRTAGATAVIQPEVEAAAALIRQALDHLALPADRRAAYLERYLGVMTARGPAGPSAPTGLPEIREVDLPAGPLADQSLREARVRERFGVSVVAITRPDGELLANPSADTPLRPGDRVRLFGLPEQIDAFVAEARAVDS